MIRDPDPELTAFLSTRDPALRELALAARSAILAQAGDCWELIYDTYALSTAFSLTEELADAFCHVAVYKKHVNLGFNRGTELDAPSGLLQGTGKLIRHLRLGGGVEVDAEPVSLLIGQAIENANARLSQRGGEPTPGGVVVKQRSNR